MNQSWNTAEVAGRPKQFLLPPSVDAALDALLAASRAEGNRMSRSDIVAALIWQSRHTDGDALGVIVRTFLRETQSVVGSPAGGGPVRPGPRPYAGSS
jgi:hypothetical protein